MDNYSISEMIDTSISFIKTKILFSNCRLLRFPIYIRGKKSIEGANRLTTGRFCRIELEGKRKTLFIGDNCQFGDNTHIVALNHVEIGNNVLIASKCFISDSNHGNYSGDHQDSPSIPPNERRIVSDCVYIGSNVWIGENVVILANSNIGNGSIIGANSVVNSTIPDNVIAVGSPAKVVKKWNKEKMIWEKINNEY